MAVTSYHTVNGRIRAESTGGARTGYLPDALGSVTATVQAGAVVNTYRYKPYGELLAKTGGGSDPRFTWFGSRGWFSEEDSLVHFRGGYYSKVHAAAISNHYGFLLVANYSFMSNPTSIAPELGHSGANGFFADQLGVSEVSQQQIPDGCTEIDKEAEGEDCIRCQWAFVVSCAFIGEPDSYFVTCKGSDHFVQDGCDKNSKQVCSSHSQAKVEFVATAPPNEWRYIQYVATVTGSCSAKETNNCKIAYDSAKLRTLNCLIEAYKKHGKRELQFGKCSGNLTFYFKKCKYKKREGCEINEEPGSAT